MYPDRFFDIDGWQWLRMTRAKQIVTHLAFESARIAPAAARDNALLQNLFQYALMKSGALLRGE